ncbi:MAG: DUF4433 domain-containing protein [Chloroflexi bacterium]|nr:DUF4433 domain-containing protein [Chloroflexota bacterium]
MKFDDIKPLAYITPIANLDSILQHGIMSHVEVQARGIHYVSVADFQIQRNRAIKQVLGTPLNQFVNLYFNPRNAMMYRVRRGTEPICIVEVSTDVLHTPGAIVSTANAASSDAEFVFVAADGLSKLEGSDVYRQSWSSIDTSGRAIRNITHMQRLQSEVLVPSCVGLQMISAVLVRDLDHQTEMLCRSRGKSVRVNKNFFFEDLSQ